MEVEELISYLFTPAAQVAVIIGLAEIVKRIGLDKRYIPILDVILGLISGILVYGLYLDYGIVTGALIGLFVGLSACGLFSGVKNVIEGGHNDEGN